MYIKNATQLLTSKLDKEQLYLRKIALQALEISISAVRPKNLIEKAIKVENNKLMILNEEYNLDNFDKLYIIGGGKATGEMASELEKVLWEAHITNIEGIINIPDGSIKIDDFKSSKIAINYASHPIPDENGLNGVKAMVEIIEKSHDKDLIIFLISGGGSALLPLPKKNISLKDLQEINSLLIASGASIYEINTIRKHLSDFKGGNLAKKLYNSSGATLISLIISDVIGNNLDFIASGPTVPDTTTFNDAIEIVKKYKLLNKIPLSTKKALEAGLIDFALENPRLDHRCFARVKNYLIGSVKSGIQEILPFLKKEGFDVIYFSSEIMGEAKDYGVFLNNNVSQTIGDLILHNENCKKALVGTGELTVTIQGEGIGGRNQEMLLSFLNQIKEEEYKTNFLVIGANFDGIDGNSEAMGALIDNFVVNQIKNQKIDLNIFLNNNDSNTLFKALESEIITGLTGCNVNDIILILISR